MTKRLVRRREFEIALQIKIQNFIRPPRDSQRNWLLNRAMTEFGQNLAALDRLAARFVPGVDSLAMQDRTQGKLANAEIMEDWQIPLMKAMASLVTEAAGDVLEIGFGRGIASSFIQDQGVRSHTVIECNDSVVQRFEDWKTRYPGREIRLVHGLWQDVLPSLGRFDGIFFHTYPLNETEFLEQIGESDTFAEHFFSHAAEHLVEGGAFTYLSNEIDSLGRPHQRSLFRHFKSIELTRIESLDLPRDVRDAWWSDSMVAVKAVK